MVKILVPEEMTFGVNATKDIFVINKTEIIPMK